MKMYKREEEVDGMVVDPLKAIHQVTGVTARELCHYFFDPGKHTITVEMTSNKAHIIFEHRLYFPHNLIIFSLAFNRRRCVTSIHIINIKINVNSPVLPRCSYRVGAHNRKYVSFGEGRRRHAHFSSGTSLSLFLILYPLLVIIQNGIAIARQINY